MSGIGPIEAEGPEPAGPEGPAPRRRRRVPRRWARFAAFLVVPLALALLPLWRLLTAHPEPPAPPAPEPALPSQRVAMGYGDPLATRPPGAAFAFTVRVRNLTGPPVTVERITQPSRALTVEIRPAEPVTVAEGEVRIVEVAIRVVDCVHVARNSGLPFLDVTLSNGERKEDHSYILGDRYARDLSDALSRACPEVRDASPSATS
ncbi:Tat pathway signal sequence domain protein [Streptomyces sp. BI20]|uniref:Tat pathway signal sequence domain protein n=1 Tax=Streptomyces sp. BI20 TaxID=3403460 RepID=UPI003C74E8C6